MTDVQGSFGRTRVFEDFLGGIANGAWAATGTGQLGALSFTSVNEGTIEVVADEPGGVVTLTTDTGGSTDTWRAAAGDVGVATGGSSNGTVSGQGAPVADEWDIFRVEIGDEGTGRCYHDGVLIDTFETAVTATDKFFAVVMIETRSGANEILEVDYVYAAGGRDWNVA